MVAPLNSARMGSGGIVLGVTADVDALRAAIPQLTAKIKQITEGLKIKPEIDFEQTAVKRALSKLRNDLTREVVKVQIQAEAQNLGLAARAVSGTPEVAFSALPANVQSRLSLRAAQAEHARKLDDDLDRDIRGRGRGNGSPDDRPGGGFLDKLGGIRAALRGGIYGYAIGQAANFTAASAGINQNLSLAGSSDPILSGRGTAGAINAAGQIPVIGNLVRAFDACYRITERLNEQMGIRLSMEHMVVTRAEAGGNPFSIVNAQAGQERLTLVREMAEMEAKHQGSKGTIASLFDWETNPENIQHRLKMNAKQQQILEAARIQKLRLTMLGFDSDTSIGTNEMRARNFGMHLADEDAMGAIRGAEGRIKFSTDRVGLNRAMLEGLSSLRAMRASLMVRGGGMAQVANLQTDLIGDPFNLDPQLAARGRALSMTSDAIGRIAQGGAPQLRINPRIAALLPAGVNSFINDMNFKAQGTSVSRALNNQYESDGTNYRDTDLATQSLVTLQDIRDILKNETFLR